ncbi:hypothetical protein JYU34_001558 [Plutella xylostella]|uniref:RING-type domain-containing protein n=1 Tax=Plutella xylostella TaxID=51655 RepID=A0ABQ7R4A4_PLUXY|nr:hypothetical protein JYU34_001558 [Plutella xylostella]
MAACTITTRSSLKTFRPAADKLLNKLEENEPELASSPEEECVICVNAKATMQTSPCGHRVVCRRCFVKTIQMAVSQRLLPLRCVICRAKILRLRQAPRLVTSKSWQVSSGSGKSWCVPGSVSSYSVGARSVPASASLYSVTSGESSLSVKAEERTFCVSSRACCSSDGDGDARGSREGPATGKLAGAPWTSNINPLLKIASPISSSQLEFGECGPRTSVTNRDLKEQMNE